MVNRESERKRLEEMLEKVLENPTLACPRFGKKINCDGCDFDKGYDCNIAGRYANYLLDNGIVVPKSKPIGVMIDGNEFNSDVYCPYCGTNLSGLYGEEGTAIIQCYICGEFLDSTKTITREDAVKALKGDEGK